MDRPSSRNEAGFTLIEVDGRRRSCWSPACSARWPCSTTPTARSRRPRRASRASPSSARSSSRPARSPTTSSSRPRSPRRSRRCPNLGDSSLGQPGWTIERRGVTYTVAIGVCSVDDPADGAGTSDTSLFCVPGAATQQQCSDWTGYAGVQGTAHRLVGRARGRPGRRQVRHRPQPRRHGRPARPGRRRGQRLHHAPDPLQLLGDRRLQPRRLQAHRLAGHLGSRRRAGATRGSPPPSRTRASPRVPRSPR